MTSRLERKIAEIWNSLDFKEAYEKMSESRQYALDLIKEAIVGKIEPRTTSNRIDYLVSTLGDVAYELSGSVRAYAARMIDVYAAHVGRTDFKKKQPEKYCVLERLSQNLTSLHVKGLRQEISRLNKENRQLRRENYGILRSSERSVGLCNSAFEWYYKNMDKALVLYKKALAVEPSEKRKKAIHACIGGLYFNNGQFSEALEEFGYCTKTKEIREMMKQCREFIRNMPVAPAPVTPAETAQDALANAAMQHSPDAQAASVARPPRQRPAAQPASDACAAAPPAAQPASDACAAAPADAAQVAPAAQRVQPAAAPPARRRPRESIE